MDLQLDLVVYVFLVLPRVEEGGRPKLLLHELHGPDPLILLVVVVALQVHLVILQLDQKVRDFVLVLVFDVLDVPHVDDGRRGAAGFLRLSLELRMGVRLPGRNRSSRAIDPAGESKRTFWWILRRGWSMIFGPAFF